MRLRKPTRAIIDHVRITRRKSTRLSTMPTPTLRGPISPSDLVSITPHLAVVLHGHSAQVKGRESESKKEEVAWEIQARFRFRLVNASKRFVVREGNQFAYCWINLPGHF
jgi:hypothetical protein